LLQEFFTTLFLKNIFLAKKVGGDVGRQNAQPVFQKNKKKVATRIFQILISKKYFWAKSWW